MNSPYWLKQIRTGLVHVTLSYIEGEGGGGRGRARLRGLFYKLKILFHCFTSALCLSCMECSACVSQDGRAKPD